MSTTLLPFLYQTRTIQSLQQTSRSIVPLINRRASSSSASPAQSPWQSSADDIPQGKEGDSSNESETYVPFLKTVSYRTAINELKSEASPGVTKDASASSASPVTPEPTAKSNNVHSTITSMERSIFESIFKEVAVLNKAPVETPRSRAPTKYQAGAKSTPAPIKNKYTTEQSEPTQHPTGAAILQKLSVEEQQKQMLLKFSGPLREIAQKAMGIKSMEAPITDYHRFRPTPTTRSISKAPGVHDGAGDQPATLEGLVRNDEDIFAMREKAQAEMQTLMENCSNDVELWRLLETRVFPIAKGLGIEDKTAATKGKIDDSGKFKPNTLASKKVLAAMSKKSAKSNALPDATNHTVNIEVYGPLYPNFMLDSLNILRTGFSRPSPLAFDLLPQLRSLGMTSYVLGASTALYNEVMKMHWAVRADLQGVFELLEEMETAGLQFDDTTAGFLQWLLNAFEVSCSGQLGGWVQELMQMPHFDAATREQVRDWYYKVVASVEEHKREFEM